MIDDLNAYERLRTMLQRKFENTPGIRKIIEFRVGLGYVIQTGGPPILLHQFLDEHGTPEAELEWIKQVLAVENIYGEFYLMYEGWDFEGRQEAPMPWVKVDLSSQYEWVEPLWNLGEGLYFLPPDLSYFFQIITEEGIPRAFKHGTRPEVSRKLFEAWRALEHKRFEEYLLASDAADNYVVKKAEELRKLPDTPKERFLKRLEEVRTARDVYNDYEQMRAILQQKFENTPGIRKIIEFRLLPSPVMPPFAGGKRILLYEFPDDGTYANEIEWIKFVLGAESIHGEFYLMYNGWDSGERPDVQKPWVKVDLSPQYEWVEPLWNIGHGLYFISADMSYFFDVSSQEDIPSAYKNKLSPILKT